MADMTVIVDSVLVLI